MNTASDGRVIQWIEVLMSAAINLDFRQCDAMSYSTSENFKCVSNRQISQFIDKLPQSFHVSLLPGFRPQKIFIKAPGPAPAFPIAYGYYDSKNKNSWNEHILSNVPNIDNDDNVTLNFNAGYNQALGRRIAAWSCQNGWICGLDEEAYKGFQNAFGNRFDNSYRQYYKIAIVWNKPSACCAYNQNIEFMLNTKL